MAASDGHPVVTFAKEQNGVFEFLRPAVFTPGVVGNETVADMGPKPIPLQSNNPFASSSLPAESFDDGGGGHGKLQEEADVERIREEAEGAPKRPGLLANSSGRAKKMKPELNIVTNLAIPNMPVLVKDMSFNQAPAQQPQPNRVAVQTHPPGQVEPAPKSQSQLSLPAHARSTGAQAKLQSLSRLAIQNNREKASAPRVRVQEPEKTDSPFDELLKIPIGICLPEDEARTVSLRLGDQSAFPLDTPVSPSAPTPFSTHQPTKMSTVIAAALRPISSVGSFMTSNSPRHPSVPGLPPMPRESSKTGRVTFASVHEDSPTIPKERPLYASSVASTDQILPASAHSARPESQGWWNLMLSPMLSQAGTLRTHKSRLASLARAVPKGRTPSNNGESSPVRSPATDPSAQVTPVDPAILSPGTPRRLGLATPRASTWSNWRSWEEEFSRQKTEQSADLDDEAEPVPNFPHRYREGSAAEYYHACAVELLTGRSYFECENHSCAEKLPKLVSIHDNRDGGETGTLASPFDDDGELADEKSLVEEQTEVSGRAGSMTASDDDDDDCTSDTRRTDGLSGSLGSRSRRTRTRTRSSFTTIGDDELSPDILSPNVRQADTAAFVKVKPIPAGRDDDSVTAETSRAVSYEQSRMSEKAETLTKASSVGPSQRVEPMPNIAMFTAPAHRQESAPVESPGPLSPEGQRSLAPDSAVPMAALEQSNASPAPQTVVNDYRSYHHPPEHPTFGAYYMSPPPGQEEAVPHTRPAAIPYVQRSAAGLFLAPPESGRDAPYFSSVEQRPRSEGTATTSKESEGPTTAGKEQWWRKCFSRKKSAQGDGLKKRKRRGIIAIAIGLLLVVVLCVVLALTLIRRGPTTPVQSQWLNLTGFPAMPTGISTIAAPNLVASENGCTARSTLWSCAVPQDNQAEIAPDNPLAPNFRFAIVFQNGTVDSNLTLPTSGPSSGKTTKRQSGSSSAPQPEPPNQADQVFLGGTTDKVTAPFNGEKTPFFITFMSPSQTLNGSSNSPSASNRLFARQNSSTTIANIFPAPAEDGDGNAADAVMVPTSPFPQSQPIRLYNRGLNDEHYGFYIYYDKSIFLAGVDITFDSETGRMIAVDSDQNNGGSSPSIENSTPSNRTIAIDQNGGSLKSDALVRCTFSQTRYLVKMFTNPTLGLSLLGNATRNAARAQGARDVNSATDFAQPGSFPYPTTITIDRHGGDIDQKAIYCYGMDGGKIVAANRTLIAEKRSVGGQLINAAPGLFTSDGFNKTAGGIDGGTGGCGCTWQNWK